MEEILSLLNSVKPDTDFGNSAVNLIEEGILDSMDIVNIIGAIEKKYNIQIEADDIDPKNFSSAENILIMVKKYM